MIDRPLYVFRTDFRRLGQLSPERANLHSVEMVPVQRLDAAGPIGAIAEAKSLGFKAPIVGLLED